MKQSLGIGVGSTVLVVVLTTALAAAAPKKPAPKAAGDAVIAAGKKVFESSGCMGCHKLAGKGQTSGPDLSQEGKAHDAVWIAKKVKNPKSIKKDSIMPPFAGSEKELKAVSAFLASLK
jgi:mono/diheme cytochrome c family protein